MDVIDLRSDTVTRPTPAMRQAMASAEVGDDCWGDDPTVKALEREVAAALGKPAGLLVASGTMANQVAVRLHTRPGSAVVACAGAHVQIHEAGGAASNAGAQVMGLGSRFGFALDDLSEHLHEEATGWPHTDLVWLENTLGLGGGEVWPVEDMEAIAEFTRARGRALHLDGARLWNAQVACGEPLPRLAACADTVSVCLSKGLGAPAGSILCGTAAHVERARSIRQSLGGGMRQAGILAAAGLHALEHHLPRLHEDHRRARTLAEGLDPVARACGLKVRPPATNLVIVEIPRESGRCADDYCEPLRVANVLVYPNLHREIRLCVHQHIDDAAVTRVIELAQTSWPRVSL